MDLKEYLVNVFKGVIAALALTIVLTGILSIIMTFAEISSALFSGIYVVITAISLVFGTILAAKLYGHNGWIVGLLVGVVFYIALYILGILFGADSTLGTYDLIRFILSIVVGVLSGMLGINLGRD